MIQMSRKIKLQLCLRCSLSFKTSSEFENFVWDLISCLLVVAAKHKALKHF